MHQSTWFARRCLHLPSSCFVSFISSFVFRGEKSFLSSSKLGLQRKDRLIRQQKKQERKTLTMEHNLHDDDRDERGKKKKNRGKSEMRQNPGQMMREKQKEKLISSSVGATTATTNSSSSSSLSWWSSSSSLFFVKCFSLLLIQAWRTGRQKEMTFTGLFALHPRLILSSASSSPAGKALMMMKLKQRCSSSSHSLFFLPMEMIVISSLVMTSLIPCPLVPCFLIPCLLIPCPFIDCKRTTFDIPLYLASGRPKESFLLHPTVHSCYSFMSFPLSLSLLISLISSSLIPGHAVSIVSFLSLGSPSRLLPLSTWSRWETKKERFSSSSSSLLTDSILVNWTPHPHLSSQSLFTVWLAFRCSRTKERRERETVFQLEDGER